MGAFVVSWLPFFIVYTFDPFFKFELSDRMTIFITWLGYINSSISKFPYFSQSLIANQLPILTPLFARLSQPPHTDPIIYTIFNMDFRIAFKRIFMKCCCTGNEVWFIIDWFAGLTTGELANQSPNKI